jgi:hypothetical protein
LSLDREWTELSKPRGSVILLDLAAARPIPGWRCIALRVYWPHRKRDMPNKSSSSSGAAVLDRERVLADLRHVLTALVARRDGVRVGWRFGSLARGNALRRPTDVLVLTAAEWRAPDGTAVSSRVVMHGIQLHPSF